MNLADLLRDDALAAEIGACCADAGHDDRWCTTCRDRTAGIDEYRAACWREYLVRQAKEVCDGD